MQTLIIILSILVILLIVLLIINYLYKKTNYYKNFISNIQKFIDGVDNEIELASFGSSYAKYGIIKEEIKNLKAFNFGIQPESINYDFKMIKMYKNNLKENCIVILNIPNLVFTFVEYKSERSNTKYYYFLDKKYINNYKKYKHFLNIHLPVLKDPFLIRYILKDTRIDNYEKRENTKLDEKGVEKEANLRIGGWKNNANISNTIDDNVSNEIKETFKKTQKILEDMIEYCIENKFRPVIVIPPVSEILSEKLSEKFLKTYLFDNIQIANKRKIPVLNYLNKEEFKDYKLYINSDFLNLKGRKILTKTILEDLKKLNYI